MGNWGSLPRLRRALGGTWSAKPPGEVVQIDAPALPVLPLAPAASEPLTFEYPFARPDPGLAATGLSSREEMGAQLAREHHVDADLVIGVPDSAIPAAIGYAREAGIPYREGLVKNRYVGRTFIQPDQRIREAGVRLKFNALSDVLAGKRVIVVDDSIVRGTTTGRVLDLIRRAGAKEVHMRFTTPPIISPASSASIWRRRPSSSPPTRRSEAIRLQSARYPWGSSAARGEPRPGSRGRPLQTLLHRIYPLQRANADGPPGGRREREPALAMAAAAEACTAPAARSSVHRYSPRLRGVSMERTLTYFR